MVSSPSDSTVSKTSASDNPLASLRLTGHWLNGEAQRQVDHLIEMAINKTTERRAFFQLSQLESMVRELASEEMDVQDVESEAFDLWLAQSLSQADLLPVERTRFLTTPLMHNMEKRCVELSGSTQPACRLSPSIIGEILSAHASPYSYGSGLLDQTLANLKQELGVLLIQIGTGEATGEKLWTHLTPHLVASNKASAAGLSTEQSADIARQIYRAWREPQGRPVLKAEWDRRFERMTTYFEEQAKPLRVGKGMSEEQTKAFLSLVGGDRRVSILEAPAGSGKSFTMEPVKEAYMLAGFQVIGTSLGWNAAQVLESSAKLDGCVATEGLVRALLEARGSNKVEYFRKPTLLIADEAGMLGTRHMYHLLEETANAGVPVKVILAGDSLQLAPVDAGAIMETLSEIHGCTRLTEIYRQNQNSHRRAVIHFKSRESGLGLWPYIQQEAIKWSKDAKSRRDLVVQEYVSWSIAHPGQQALLLALSNKEVLELNQSIRDIYKRLGRIHGNDVTLKVTDGQRIWDAGFAIGDEVVVRNNDKRLPVYDLDSSLDATEKEHWSIRRFGVYNRNTGIVRSLSRNHERFKAGSWDIVIDLYGEKGGRIVINTKDFRHPEKHVLPVVHNFATTIHGSQGQTVPQTFLLDSPMFNFRLAYVAMSRHQMGAFIYLDEQELHRRLDWVRGNRNPDAHCPLGRYSRAEMLGAVSRSWSKDSVNLTSVMLAREHRFGKPKSKPWEQLARIRPWQCSDEEIVDFIPGESEDPPQVDIRSILKRPLEPAREDVPSASGEAGLEVPSAFQGPELSPAEPRTLLDVMHALKKKVLPAKPSLQPLSQPIGERTLHPQFKAEHLPFLPSSEPVLLAEDGSLSFAGAPQTPGSKDPDPAYVASLKGKAWGIGRNGAPRILALGVKGEVLSRYRLDGTCVAGDGMPPILPNPVGDARTPVMIAPGAKEWLLLAEQHLQGPTPNSPHLVWGAVGADLAKLLPSLEKRNAPVIVARSRVDDSQIAWATKVSNLLSRHGVAVRIVPSLPQPQPKTETSPALGL